MNEGTVDAWSDVAADVACLDGGPALYDACGGAPSGLVTLASAIRGAGCETIAVTGDTGLWANYSGWQSSLDGCNTPSFPNRSAESMVVLGSGFYWADDIQGSLSGAPLSGSPVTTLVHRVVADVPERPFRASYGVNLYRVYPGRSGDEARQVRSFQRSSVARVGVTPLSYLLRRPSS